MLVAAFFLASAPPAAFTDSPLEPCKGQFIDGDLANAPAISESDDAFGDTTLLCYRVNDASFFALEYWREQLTPRWVAYELTPINYGTDGCSTYTRGTGNCYVQEDTWSQFQACEDGSDPFHSDHMLSEPKLSADPFSNTGHDRGHLAPRQAFSWHVCGTYKTFSLANMSPQSAYLNQNTWQALEQQELTWAFDSGPMYIVSGTIFTEFPHTHFAVYEEDNVLDDDQIYASNNKMKQVVKKLHDNFLAHPSDHILHPKRDGKPNNIRAEAKELRLPTGYFKVIYRPAIDGEPAHAIGFLLPHSLENLDKLVEGYHGMPVKHAFWAFASKISLIESESGVSFPGIPDDLKEVWRDDWFFSRKTSRNIRKSSCGVGNPQGVLVNSALEERLQACTDQLQ
ncbi:MAG: DNA/RNA non-specific endonuclease [Steroidobacteraceae bacterium]